MMDHPELTPSRNVCGNNTKGNFQLLHSYQAPTHVPPQAPEKMLSVCLAASWTPVPGQWGLCLLSFCVKDTYGVLGFRAEAVPRTELLSLWPPLVGCGKEKHAGAPIPASEGALFPSVSLSFAKLSSLMASLCKNRKYYSLRVWTWPATRSNVSRALRSGSNKEESVNGQVWTLLSQHHLPSAQTMVDGSFSHLWLRPWF